MGGDKSAVIEASGYGPGNKGNGIKSGRGEGCFIMIGMQTDLAYAIVVNSRIMMDMDGECPQAI
jgi:hypothetical protein